MDGHRFDELTRTLAMPTTRRGLLAGLAGLAIGLGGRATNAGAACAPDQVARRGGGCVCRTTGRPPDASGCPCQGRLTKCEGVCLDTGSDALNCGGCGVVCPVPEHGRAVCRQGVCEVKCDAGHVQDGTDCVRLGACVDDGTACGDLECGTAVNNCGQTVSCGDCPPADACLSYVCRDGTCTPFETICPPPGPCTISQCDPELGCVDKPVPAGEQGGCPDGESCNADGACAAICAAICAAEGESCSRPDGSNQGTCCSDLTCWDSFKGPAFAKCVPKCALPGDLCSTGGGRCCDSPGDTSFCGSGIFCPV